MVYQIATLLLLAAFYGCYFTKMICQSRAGIQTNQLGKNKNGFVKVIEIFLKATTCIVPIVEVISIIFNTSMLPEGFRIAGVATAFLGVAVFITAVITMKDSWRAGVSEHEKTELVTKGVFSLSRNPAFLGFDLLYIGVLLCFFNWVLFALSVLAGLLLHLQIVNVEEDYLLAAFGDEYREYKNKVCRYIGRKL